MAILQVCLILFYDSFFAKPPVSIPRQEVSLSGRITGITLKKSKEGINYSITVEGVRRPYHKLLLRVEEALTIQVRERTKGRVFHLGDSIFFEGSFSSFKEPRNKGSFDAKSYYRNEGYNGYVKVKTFSRQPPSPLIGLVYFLPDFSYGLRQKMVERLNLILGEVHGGTLSAMILGEKAFLEEEIKNLYTDNAISHVLAISGLHVAIIGALIYKLFQKTKLSFRLTNLLPILFLFFYGILIGFPISAIRAVTMMSLLFLSYALKKSYDIPSALAFSSILILFINPRSLYQASFQLSFVAVLAIFYALKITEKIFLAKKKNRERKIDLLLSFLYSSILSTLTISLFLLPFQLWHFYEVAFNGLFLNIIVIPLMSILVFTGLMGGFLSLFSVWIGSFFLGSADVILGLYLFLGRIMSLNPWNKIILGRPSVGQGIIYYSFIFLLLTWIWKIERREQMLAMREKLPSFEYLRGKRIKKLLVLFCLPFAIFFLAFRHRSDVIEKLDVGKGYCKVVRMKKGYAYLIDCGSKDLEKIAKYQVIPYLKFYGISRVKGIFLTELKAERMNGLKDVLEKEEIKSERIILPKGYKGKEGILFQEILPILKKKSIEILYLGEDEEVKDGRLSIQFRYQKERKERKTVVKIEKKE